MFESRFLIYFLLGGFLITLITYFGAHGRGWLAAFIAMFPAMTVLTFYTIYFEAGSEAILSYIKGMMSLTPAWVCYLVCVMGTISKYGIGPALVFGIVVYVVSAWLMSRVLF